MHRLLNNAPHCWAQPELHCHKPGDKTSCVPSSSCMGTCELCTDRASCLLRWTTVVGQSCCLLLQMAWPPAEEATLNGWQ